MCLTRYIFIIWDWILHAKIDHFIFAGYRSIMEIQNNIKLIKVLFFYTNQGHNIKKTKKQLHIVRNTWKCDNKIDCVISCVFSLIRVESLKIKKTMHVCFILARYYIQRSFYKWEVTFFYLKTQLLEVEKGVIEWPGHADGSFTFCDNEKKT